MTPKKGICTSCEKETYIYSRKMCQYCYWKSKPKKPLNIVTKKMQPFSAKKLEELKVYRKLRDNYLKENPICERCGEKSEDLHHKKPREHYLNDVSIFCSLCRKCHIWVHDNDKESREQGYLLSKH